MLERGGVEHHVGTVVGEDLVEGLDVADVAEHHVGGVEQPLVVDGQLGAVQPGLVAVQHDELLGSEAVHLAGQLGADGAAGPGHEHHLAGQVVGDLPEVGLDLGAAQQVGDVQLVQVAQAHASRDEVLGGRHHEGLQAGPVGELGDLTHERAIRGRDGDDELLNAVLARDGDDLLPVAEDLGALDVQIALGRVVVDVADDLVRGVGVVGQETSELLARVARAVDEDRLAVLVTLGGAADGAEQEPARSHQHQRRQGHGEGDHPRIARGGEEDREDTEHQPDPEGDQGQEGRLLERSDDVTATVEPRQQADDDLQDDGRDGVLDDELRLRPGQREGVAREDKSHRGDAPARSVPQGQSGSEETGSGGHGSQNSS